ncbi:MAG: hypothetical protein HKN81_03200 [Gammaproteobacteria bacterium]|nr:hypothetical protein [Gammaproteobacteria bacterium]NND36121.1 hypothetical protein [Gammaproteobacteria bacterium]
MRLGAAPDIGQVLRSLPDMAPPPDAWRKIRARTRSNHAAAWAGIAVAACMAMVAFMLVTRDEAPVEPVETFLVEAQPLPGQADEDQRRSASVEELRQRSQHMERVLRGLPRSPEVVRVDVAGAIADLQDRIAAVDYELSRSTRTRRAQQPSSIVRWPSGNESAFRPASQSAPPAGRDLWQQRVELMDRLVRARYAEVGAEAR